MDWLNQVTNPELSSLGQIYQADLSKIGVQMSLKSLDSNAFIDATNRLAYRGVAGTLSSYTQVHPSSVFVLSRAFFPTNNTAGFKSEAYTQLVNQLSTEPDDAKRAQLYAQMNDLLLDESFLMPLAPQRSPMVMKANVHGPRRDMAGGVYFTDTWMG
jgi:ABC-type transport system substrate-binding protein